MRARAHLISPGRRHSSSFISYLDYVLKVFDTPDPILTQVLHYDTLRWVLEYGQILLLLIWRLLGPVSTYPIEQVFHLLVVDLQKTHADCRFTAAVASFVIILFKKLLHRQICDSSFSGIRTARTVPNDARAKHCMCLSCPGHTIREASGIVSLFELGKERLDSAGEYLGVGLIVIENLMESELAVSHAQVVVDQVTVMHTQRVLVILVAVCFDDRIAFPTVGRDMR